MKAPSETRRDLALSSPRLPIYLDNHATTPVDPRVLEEMLPYLKENFGNAASRGHSFGWKAQEGVELARSRVAKLIGAKPSEIVFTSGATESDNLAIRGVAEAYKSKGNHIITAVTEHKAVLDSCKRLELAGYRVTYLGVKRDGLLDLDQLRDAMNEHTLLVSIMAANNEIGVLQPWAEIGRICREKNVLFHSDATQAAGKVPLNVEFDQLDLASISAHKMYGPKGVGALYVRGNPAVRLSAILDGGGHENGMRSGTLNVPGIVGLGKACAIAEEEMAEEANRLTALRRRLYDRITQQVSDTFINGSIEHRLPGNLNMCFAGVEAQTLLTGIPEVAVSSGAACTSATREASHVLRALGLSEEPAEGSIRFGIGRFNTEEEIDYAADRFAQTVNGLRELAIDSAD
jgi:cysteine desulfurase